MVVVLVRDEFVVELLEPAAQHFRVVLDVYARHQRFDVVSNQVLLQKAQQVHDAVRGLDYVALAFLVRPAVHHVVLVFQQNVQVVDVEFVVVDFAGFVVLRFVDFFGDFFAALFVAQDFSEEKDVQLRD